ncbi:hypothetical protein TcasGA2_TC034876 [Tribolium castaneum]|uniref:Uncharacterized protein n=1 Tax=Tribolium castaneum TaxID=7070 RepID=A0A139WB78_TRICA|nr:hypothetical protein TcasGA2_TC034876 [Tribolium castaneum]
MKFTLFFYFCTIFFIHLNITPTPASQTQDDISKLPFLKRIEKFLDSLLSQFPLESSKAKSSNFFSQPLALLYSQKKEPPQGLSSYFFSQSDPSKQMQGRSLGSTAFTWLVPGGRAIYDCYTKAIQIKDMITGAHEKRSLSSDLIKILPQIF